MPPLLWMALTVVAGFAISSWLARFVQPKPHPFSQSWIHPRSGRPRGFTIDPMEGHRRPAILGRDHRLLRYEERFALRLPELQQLFEEAWGATKPRYWAVLDDCYAWVTHRSGGRLTGFANIAWDGGVHFFLLDVTVHPAWRGNGIARQLVQDAIELCREHQGWLHVDAPQELMNRLYIPCGFKPTAGGLFKLEADLVGAE